MARPLRIADRRRRRAAEVAVERHVPTLGGRRRRRTARRRCSVPVGTRLPQPRGGRRDGERGLAGNRDARRPGACAETQTAPTATHECSHGTGGRAPKDAHLTSIVERARESVGVRRPDGPDTFNQFRSEIRLCRNQVSTSQREPDVRCPLGTTVNPSEPRMPVIPRASSTPVYGLFPSVATDARQSQRVTHAPAPAGSADGAGDVEVGRAGHLSEGNRAGLPAKLQCGSSRPARPGSPCRPCG